MELLYEEVYHQYIFVLIFFLSTWLYYRKIAKYHSKDTICEIYKAFKTIETQFYHLVSTPNDFKGPYLKYYYSYQPIFILFLHFNHIGSTWLCNGKRKTHDYDVGTFLKICWFDMEWPIGIFENQLCYIMFCWLIFSPQQKNLQRAIAIATAVCV